MSVRGKLSGLEAVLTPDRETIVKGIVETQQSSQCRDQYPAGPALVRRKISIAVDINPVQTSAQSQSLPGRELKTLRHPE